MQLCN